MFNSPITMSKPIKVENYNGCGWDYRSSEGHILYSTGDQCEKFQKALPAYIPAPPEMTFADNNLTLTFNSDFTLNFDALSALKLVSETPTVEKVSCSNEWKAARIDSEMINAPVIHNFDWTYSTKYSGTLKSSADIKIEKTDEIIDMARLQTKDAILFFADILLFEDELADNGRSTISVKIRVMPTLYFILLRHYLRVDGVKIKVIDTRYYHEFGKDFILRENTELENDYIDLENLGTEILTDTFTIIDYLKKTSSLTEKIYI